MAKKKEKTEKRKVSEIFEVEKEGKEEVKKVSGEEVVEVEKKNQAKEENKILRNFFIGIGAFILLVGLLWWVIGSARQFEYNGLDFKIIKEGKIIFYNIAFPVIQNGRHIADHNFYIRNDPRKLKEIPFEGNLDIREYLIFNSEESFNCDGKGLISIANLNMLYEFIGVKVGKDVNATCDSEGKYMLLNLKTGEESKITQIGPACYDLEIADCKILEVTERFMVETFEEINKELEN